MDAFFAAVEQRDHPEYRGKPVIVGSDPKEGKGRGIVATCSYEARKYGVHSAQPISQAWRKCPQGIYVQPGMSKYVRISERLMEILLEFTDLLEQVSIDEAFLDVSGSRRLHGTGPVIARKVKDRIFRDQMLTASVGVAASKFVAKVASDLHKPDGLVVVEPGREREFLAPLPVSRLWGVGKRTEEELLKLGFTRVGQVAEADREYLAARLGASAGAHLWELANGIDDRVVSPEEGYKSVGHETTFVTDVDDAEVIHDALLELTEKTCRRLRAHRALGRTITVKYREADFTTFTRRQSLRAGVDTTEAAFPIAWNLIRSMLRRGRRVRLVGVYLSNLLRVGKCGQLELFDSERARDRRLAEAVDDIARRFGDHSITRAALVGGTHRRPKIGVD